MLSFFPGTPQLQLNVPENIHQMAEICDRVCVRMHIAICRLGMLFNRKVCLLTRGVNEFIGCCVAFTFGVTPQPNGKNPMRNLTSVELEKSQCLALGQQRQMARLQRRGRWVKRVEDEGACKQMPTKLKGGKDKLNSKIKNKII